MNNEKIIKKLLSKSRSNILISKFFDEFTPDKLLTTDDDGISDVVDFYTNHFKSQDAEIRLDIVDRVKELNLLLNDTGLEIINNLKSKIENEYDAIAESLGDKVLAFYFNNKDSLRQAVTLAEFYKINNYNRYEGGGKITNIDVDVVKADLEESINNKLVDNDIADSFDIEIYKYSDLLFVKVKFTKSGEIYFMYNPVSKDIIVRSTFRTLKAFDAAALILLKINKHVIEEKFIAYDLQPFDIDMNSSDTKAPLGDAEGITNWKVKAIRLKNENDEIIFNFKLEEDSLYMSKYVESASKLGLHTSPYKISQVSLMFKVTNSKKNFLINIKNNKSNINILKKEHVLIENLLKNKGIHLDWKVKEL